MEYVVDARALETGKAQDLPGTDLEVDRSDLGAGAQPAYRDGDRRLRRNGLAVRKGLAQAASDHLGDDIRNRRFGNAPRALVATIANDRDAVGDGEDFLQAVRDVDDGQTHVPQP